MKKSFIVAIIFISIFTIFTAQLEAHAQIILGHITGTATDAVTGLPIDNATITAVLDSTIKGVALTNGTGYYDISGLNGNFTGIIYNVTATKIGYNASSVLVTMYSSIDFVVSVSQNFTLTPAPPIPEFAISAISSLIFLVSSFLLVFLIQEQRTKHIS